jgi:hypothetical protein
MATKKPRERGNAILDKLIIGSIVIESLTNGLLRADVLER